MRPPPSFGPPLVALALAAALAGGWRVALGSVPRADRLPATAGALRWAGPGVGPLVLAPSRAAARTVVVGDSRVDAGVSPARLDRAWPGGAPSALAWAHGARTLDLLAAPDVLAAGVLVVQLSPLGLEGIRNPIVSAMLRLDGRGRPPAPLREDATLLEVEDWAVRERAQLVGSGLAPAFVDQALAWWVERAAQERGGWSTARVDQTLARAVGDPRRWWLRPIEPALWRTTWRRAQDPRASLADYGRHLAPARAAARRDAAAALGARLAALAADGRRVACVRLPVSPEQRALEDERVPPALLAGVAAAAGAPFLDLGAWEGATTDGSHLAWDAALRASDALGRWLAAELGPGDGAGPR